MKHTRTISGYLCMAVFTLTFILAGCPPDPITTLSQSVAKKKTLTLSLDKKIARINDKNKIIVYKQSANDATDATKIEQDGFTATLADGTLVITLKNAIEENEIAYVLLKANAVTYEGKELASNALAFMRTVYQAYGYISRYYYKEVNERAILDGTLRGMMSNLGDPYSTYITPEQEKLRKESRAGKFGRLGISIKRGLDEEGDQYIKVVDVIKASPAESAGMRSGDLIISIDGKSTKNMSTNDAAKRMRGKPDTTVTLEIKRKGEPKLLTVIITRKVITIANVKHYIINGYANIAYLSIREFNEPTKDVENENAYKGVKADVKDALEYLNERGYKTLIIDLRNNPGGQLDSVVEIANYFLGEGKLIIGTKTRTESWNQDREYRATSKMLVDKDKKIVVMINGHTASASEILSGAIRFNGRGILVGEKTYGKGLVQSVSDFHGGRMKLTTSEYYIAGKHFINKEGILPDIVIKDMPNIPIDVLDIGDYDHVLQQTLNKIRSKGFAESYKEYLIKNLPQTITPNNYPKQLP